jgi:phospholipase/lecithinase/hemolysin
MTGSAMFVFGDSVSDTGNSFAFTGGLIPPSLLYFNGRYSNGPVAVEILDSLLGDAFTLDPTNNFAFGGATTGRENSIDNDLGTNFPGVLDEIDAYAARVGSNGVDPDGLYIIWAGPNDLIDPLLGTSNVDPSLLIQQGTLNLVNAAKTLSDLGAENIVMPSLLNLGRLPISQDNPIELTAVSKAFNASVALGLGNLDFEVTSVDLYGAGEAIAANPASFGFSNTTDALLYRQLGPNPPSNPEEYFFWDSLHPTTQGHAVLADTLARTITGEISQLSFNDVSGTDGNNFLKGTSANDNMDGFAGDDTLKGLQGNDRIEGWEGDDRLYGNQGDDILSGDDGADSLWGAQGSDIGFGGNGDDLLFGDAGDDILIGDAGDDQIRGGQGDDYLVGGEGADKIWGNDGKDILNGGAGADELLGGLGSDRLDGGADNDQLTGGRGDDEFVYRSGSSADEITDFVQGSDKIDLTSFGFTTFGTFTASVTLTGDLIDFGSGNTLQLLRTDVSTLSASDFILA